PRARAGAASRRRAAVRRRRRSAARCRARRRPRRRGEPRRSRVRPPAPSCRSCRSGAARTPFEFALAAGPPARISIVRVNPTFLLGGELEVRRLGFGAMRIVADPAEGVRVLRRAVELGVTLVDTADIYGGGRAEGSRPRPP